MAWGHGLLRACLTISGTKTGSANVGRRRLTGPDSCMPLAPRMRTPNSVLSRPRGDQKVTWQRSETSDAWAGTATLGLLC
jgi:hypothetical protein